MSPSVTVGERIEFDLSHYPRIRVYDARVGHDRYLYLHRCVAYAHGFLDDLWEGTDVHHKDCDNWNNHPENLEALPREEHEKIERQVRNLK